MKHELREGSTKCVTCGAWASYGGMGVWNWDQQECPGFREFGIRRDIGGPYPVYEHVSLKLWPDGRVTWEDPT